MQPESQRNTLAADIRHFHTYGQPGSSTTCAPPSAPLPERPKATSTSWGTKSLLRPVTSPWHLSLSPAVLAALTHGFIPREMEDKWFVYAEESDSGADMRVRFFRSWTGFEIAVLLIRVSEGQGVIEEIVWESNRKRIRGLNEEGAKRMVAEVCRWVLGVEIGGEGEGKETQEGKDGEDKDAGTRGRNGDRRRSGGEESGGGESGGRESSEGDSAGSESGGKRRGSGGKDEGKHGSKSGRNSLLCFPAHCSVQ